MTVIHLPRCGKDVDGYPCMRVPGHAGACINAMLPGPPAEFDDYLMPSLPRWKIRVILVSIWMIITVQLGVDAATVIYLWRH